MRDKRACGAILEEAFISKNPWQDNPCFRHRIDRSAYLKARGHNQVSRCFYTNRTGDKEIGL